MLKKLLMKQKKKVRIINKLIIVLLLTLVFPNKINAISGNFSIECNENTLKNGDVAKCFIKGNNIGEYVSSFHGKLLISNGIALKSINKDSIWEGGINNNTINLYTAENKTGDFNVVSFEFEIPSSINQITIMLNEIVISDENFNEIELSNITKTIYLDGDNSNNNMEDEPQNTNVNVNVNPPTGVNYVIVGVISIFAFLMLILFLKKGFDSNEE